MLEKSQRAAPQPELTGALADISRKIDALESGAVNDVLAQRLDYLARRIDEMEFQPLQPTRRPDRRRSLPADRRTAQRHRRTPR
jgi:localization factor PodJL